MELVDSVKRKINVVCLYVLRWSDYNTETRMAGYKVLYISTEQNNNIRIIMDKS